MASGWNEPFSIWILLFVNITFEYLTHSFTYQSINASYYFPCYIARNRACRLSNFIYDFVKLFTPLSDPSALSYKFRMVKYEIQLTPFISTYMYAVTVTKMVRHKHFFLKSYSPFYRRLTSKQIWWWHGPIGKEI